MFQVLQAQTSPEDEARETAAAGLVYASVIDTAAGLAELAEAWQALFERSGCGNPYLSYEWMHGWWRQWGGRGRLFVVAVWQAGARLVGVAPFYCAAAPGLRLARRVLGFLASTGACCDHLDLLAEPGLEQPIAAAIAAQILARRRAWDCLELAHADAGSPRLAALRQALRASGLAEHQAPAAVCPYLPLPQTYPQFLAGLSGSMRKNLRRSLRSLEQKGPVQVQCVSGPDGMEAAFAELVRLHGLRFDQRSHPSSFLKPELQAFHRDVLMPLTRRGLVRIYQLRVGGQLVSALYGFAAGGRFYHYQAGMDPAWLRDGVGALCIAGVIEDCIARGDREYDFLCGEEEYKSYWTRIARRDAGYRFFDARLAGRLEHARLRWLDRARALRRSLQRGGNPEKRSAPQLVQAGPVPARNHAPARPDTQ